MKFLRQSSTATVAFGPFISKNDGITPITGSTLSSAPTNSGSSVCQLFENGTASNWSPASWSYSSGGMFLAGLSATDTGTIGRLRIYAFDYNTYNPVWDDYTVLPQAVFDALIGTNASPGAGYSTYAGGAVASVTAGVTVATNNDKSGYSLATAPPTATAIATAVWTDTTAGDFTTASSPGKILTTNLDAQVSTRLPTSSYTAPTDPWATALPGSYGTGTAGKILGSNLDAAVSSRSTFAGGAVTSVTAPVTVGTNNDKSGYSLSTAPPTLTQIVNGVWDEATSGHSTAGSFGLVVSTNLDTNVGSRLPSSSYTAPPSAATNAAAVWDAATSGHASAGSFGLVVGGQLGGAFSGSTSVFTAAALANAPTGSGGTGGASAATVWQDLTSGADFEVSGSIGQALLTALGRIDATISSRSTYAGGPVASVTAGVTVADKTGFKLASDGLDQVQVDGVNFRQSQVVIMSGVLGNLAGADTGSFVVSTATTVHSGNPYQSGTPQPRITLTGDTSGNRSNVQLFVPA